MKELFNKLSNSFNFFKGSRLVYQRSAEAPRAGGPAEAPEGAPARQKAQKAVERGLAGMDVLESEKITESDIKKAIRIMPNTITGMPKESRFAEEKMSSAMTNARNNVLNEIVKAFPRLPKGVVYEMVMEYIQISKNPTSINGYMATIELSPDDKERLVRAFASGYNKQQAARFSRR